MLRPPRDDLLAVFLEVVHAPPILGAPNVAELMDGWRYRCSESELIQIRAMAEEIKRRLPNGRQADRRDVS
jgi:hypothetical protein